MKTDGPSSEWSWALCGIVAFSHGTDSRMHQLRSLCMIHCQVRPTDHSGYCPLNEIWILSPSKTWTRSVPSWNASPAPPSRALRVPASPIVEHNHGASEHRCGYLPYTLNQIQNEEKLSSAKHSCISVQTLAATQQGPWDDL